MNAYIQRIKTLISDNKIEDAFTLCTDIELTIHQSDRILLLRGQYKKLSGDIGLGILSYNDAFTHANQIQLGFLSLLNDIDSEVPILKIKEETTIKEENSQTPPIVANVWESEPIDMFDLSHHIANKELMKHNHHVFFELAWDYHLERDTFFDGIRDKLGDYWEKYFTKSPQLFFKQIKDNLKKESNNPTLFNALNKAIRKDLKELSDSQKAFGSLLLTSKCIDFAHNQYPPLETLREEFLVLWNKIIAKIFGTDNFKMAQLKEILFDEPLVSPLILPEKQRLVDLLNEKLGLLKDKIKVIFKVLEWDFKNKAPIPQFVVEELGLFFDKNTKTEGFFNPKGVNIMPKSEQRVLGDFHNLFREIRGIVRKNKNGEETYQNLEKYYNFLNRETTSDNFNYYSMTLLVGLAQFWLIEPEKNFLGKWFD